MLKPIVVAFAAFASCAAALPASAAEVPSQAVQLAGLDPAKPEDARAIQRRIARAAEAVCGSYFDTRADEETAITQCRADVARQVETQLAQLRTANQLAAR